MRITTKGRYAMLAITNLALNKSGKPKAIKIIAAEEEISPEFLEQIFFKLKKKGIIDSVRGPGGGFLISKDPSTITIKMIFDAVEEGLELTPCTSCDDLGVSVCQNSSSCLMHDIWVEANDHVNSFFTKNTLQSIIDRSTDKKLQELLVGADVTL